MSLRSIRNELSDREHKNSFDLNIKYEDICHPLQFKKKSFIISLLCNTVSQENQCCRPGLICTWVEKWLSKINYQNYEEKQKSQMSIKSQIFTQIQKDIPRTQPNCLKFQQLKGTLISYSQSNHEVGYVQGMNLIASAIVYHSNNIYQCIRIFEYIMKQLNLRSIYLGNLSAAKKHAQQIALLLKKKSYQLYRLLIHEFELQLEIFITGWLFSLLGSFIPLKVLHLVIQNFIQKGWKFIYSLIVTLLIYLRNSIELCQDSSEVMAILPIQGLTSNEINWEELINSSHNLPLNEKQIHHF